MIKAAEDHIHRVQKELDLYRYIKKKEFSYDGVKIMIQFNWMVTFLDLYVRVSGSNVRTSSQETAVEPPSFLLDFLHAPTI